MKKILKNLSLQKKLFLLSMVVFLFAGSSAQTEEIISVEEKDSQELVRMAWEASSKNDFGKTEFCCG